MGCPYDSGGLGKRKGELVLIVLGEQTRSVSSGREGDCVVTPYDPSHSCHTSGDKQHGLYSTWWRRIFRVTVQTCGKNTTELGPIVLPTTSTPENVREDGYFSRGGR